MKEKSLPLRSTMFFPVGPGEHPATANRKASDYARRYTAGLYPRYQSPRLIVSYDKEQNGYFVEPSPEYVPAKNEAWLCMIREEKQI